MSSHSGHPPQPQLSSLGWACTRPARTVPPPHCVASVSVHVCVWMRHVYILGEFSAFWREEQAYLRGVGANQEEGKLT